MTTSETARHGRAELETIVAGLQVPGLARLLEVARRLLEEQDAPRAAQPQSDVRNAVAFR